MAQISIKTFFCRFLFYINLKKYITFHALGQFQLELNLFFYIHELHRSK